MIGNMEWKADVMFSEKKANIELCNRYQLCVLIIMSLKNCEGYMVGDSELC